MPSLLIPLAILAFGGSLLVAGVAAYSGRARGWLRLYQNPEIPLPMRNGGLVGIPVGIAMLLIGLAAIASGLSLELRVGAALMALSLLVISALASCWPPEPLKPRWLRQAEEIGTVSRPTLTVWDRLAAAVIVTLASVATVALVAILVRAVRQ